MDAELRELAGRQDDLVAAWQLDALGWTRWMIDHRVQEHGWQVVHAGVYCLSAAPLRPRQRWLAATLTTPDTVLSHSSAGAYLGFLQWSGRVEIVTRPGSGGRRHTGALTVCRSTTLAGEVARHHGIRVTTAARTLIDLAPDMTATQIGRAFREAVRLRVTTVERVASAVMRHRRRRGVRQVAELCTRYEHLPYARTRSNAEGRALEIIADAGVDLPLVNVVVAGEEADLVDPHRKRIIEIDGNQFHLFPAEDERKSRAWRNAGYTVRRLPSNAVFTDPAALLRLVLE